ncbi:MAG: transporter substrate-binding domain-containing protein [Stappiaceae bacterium]
MKPKSALPAIVLLGALVFSGSAIARCEDYQPGPKPQNTGRDSVGQDLDTIIDRGFIEFAVYEDFAPFSYRQDGKVKGVDIEIGNLIAADLGVEAKFNLVTAGENLDADLRNYVWKGPLIGGAVSNVMLHVPYDSDYACRVEQVVFTGQYYEEAVAIAFLKEAYPEDPPVPAYFRFDDVAVENDSIADFYLSSVFGGQLQRKVKRYPNVVDAMGALNNGEVKAAMAPRGQLEFGMTSKTGIHQPPLPGFAVGRWTVGVAVNFRYRPLAYAVDDAISNGIETGKIAKIFSDYGLSFTPPER